jgi:prevent-host-death family protein
MSEQRMGVRELRDQLGKRIDAAHYLGESTVIDKSGEPRAVLVSYEWWREIVGTAGPSVSN